MDKQHVTLLVLLDLSAAFDTVNHKILLNIMEKEFGVVDIALKWLHSYLADKKQQVNVNNHLSEEFSLSCGVPQGSCLGPVLFLFYIARLYSIIEKHLPKAHGYADDTQLYLSFRPHNHVDEDHAVMAMESCIKDVRSWMVANRLMINDNKTELLVIGTRQQLGKVRLESIMVGECAAEPVESVRNLGSWFDKNMNMDTHIGKVCSKAFRGLYQIRQIRKFLDKSTTETLIHAFVTSHVDYCNALLYGLPRYQLTRLQKILNAAARVVSSVSKYDHITPTLKKLHWLPIEKRIDFKILLLVFKGLYGKAPAYIKDLLIVDSKCTYGLRSKRELRLIVPKSKCKTLGDRAFAHSAPVLWNNLPNYIREVTSIGIFKKTLKTYLFKLAYK
jgi:hypothetical protein